MIERARHRGGATIFFLDEIHRFNKAQQDALLPAVEEGARDADRRDDREPALRGQQRAALARHGLRARGARARTTSRAAARAPASAARSATSRSTTTRSSCSRGAAAATRGSRSSALERAAAIGDRVDVAAAREALAAGLVRYDRAGDQHYDTISAWIKATRGSDPDASLYYLATMLEGGEDPRFIARRMVILASEDIGNADPEALVVAVAAAAAVEHVGLPECSYALAQAAIRLSLAPKSDAAGRALGAARELIRREGARRAPGDAARRRRLRQPARPPGSHQRAGADAGRARGRPLLRARRRRGRRSPQALARVRAAQRSARERAAAGGHGGRHAAVGCSCACRTARATSSARRRR